MRRALLLLTAGLVLAPMPAAKADVATGRLLVSLRAPAGDRAVAARAAVARAFVARTGARVTGAVVPQIGLVTVRPPAGVSLHAFAQRLRGELEVRAVQAEYRATLRYVPNDPAFSVAETASGTPPDTPVEWWAPKENLPAAWDITKGDGATVAVIDTGVDGGHPELSGHLKATVDQDATPGDGPATTDESGHGTHVASLACGTGDNGIGLAGAGLHCDLIIEKSDLSGGSVAAAIVDAANRGADAINMSFGTDGSQPAPQAEVDAINYAYARNVIMAAAAADDSVQEQGDPANVLQPAGTGPDMAQGKGLSVTAATFADQRASFAGNGSEISIAAYGAFSDTQGQGPPGIFGAFPAGSTQLESGSLIPFEPPCGCRTTFQGDSRYAYLMGTSMATPMVAAAAALVRHFNPDLTAADVIALLKTTARRPAGTGWSPDLGWGILDAGAALAGARGIDRHPPTSRLRAQRHVRRRSFLLRWVGSDPAPAGVVSSGIAEYEVWRSVNGRRPRRIARTRKTSLRVRGKPGSLYGFYTIAIDRAGNREPAPLAPDARVRVLRGAR